MLKAFAVIGIESTIDGPPRTSVQLETSAVSLQLLGDQRTKNPTCASERRAAISALAKYMPSGRDAPRRLDRPTRSDEGPREDFALTSCRTTPAAHVVDHEPDMRRRGKVEAKIRRRMERIRSAWCSRIGRSRLRSGAGRMSVGLGNRRTSQR